MTTDMNTDDMLDYKCDRCEGKGLPTHGCPFLEDVHADYDTKCNCCEDCMTECENDI